MNSTPQKMHAGLHVSDLQRTIEFYTRFLGTQPVKVKPGYAKFELDDPALVLSFIEDKGRVHPRFGHLGFRVASAEDLNIRLWQARKSNLIPEEEHHTACCYARQDKFWVTDPDGIRWEVYVLLEDVESNDAQRSAAAVCCAPAND